MLCRKILFFIREGKKGKKEGRKEKEREGNSGQRKEGRKKDKVKKKKHPYYTFYKTQEYSSIIKFLIPYSYPI